MEGRVQRTLGHLKDVLREILDPFADAPPVHRFVGKGPEDEHVQCPAEDIVG